MSDELLPYYNRELSYVRRLAAEFAEAHPKIAGRLRLGPDASADPHVERLIEGFAYLTARVRHKLDDEFPELTEALLGVLYPHYLAPIPSMAVVQLELDPEQDRVTAGHRVPRGAAVETDPIAGEPCRFRTGYDATLWPIAVRSASLSRRPFAAPSVPEAAEAAAVLRLTLEGRSADATFAAMAPGRLRFFLKGAPQTAFPLYELLLNDAVAVALAGGPDDPSPIVLGPEALQPVGFGPDEGLLPYDARSFLGYRLLTEFFVFAEKFLFVDLQGLDARTLAGAGRTLEVFVYLRRPAPELERSVAADAFRLGCTPVVNLYRQRAEPIRLTGAAFEYRLVPDARRPLAHEVYTVDRVTATSPDGAEEVEYRPFFSARHAAGVGSPDAFWYASRRASEAANDPGTEVDLCLVDLDRLPAAPADWTLDVELTCLSRDLPQKLPFGGGQPPLHLGEGDALIRRVECLTPPTATLRPARRQGALWGLISHLSLNHLSLCGDAEALREVLKLYDFADSAETRTLIDGILRVASRPVVGRVGGGPGAFCRGVEVAVQFDERRYSGGGLFLFATVLERFFALYTTINSFTRFVATVKGREGELRRWPPRMGERTLV